MSEPTASNLESIAAGRYEVRGLLGQGGMAAVYRVYDRRLRVECAIKVLAPEFSAKGDLRKRFESEASTMARLRHTNIAAVYDIGDDNGSPYLVMELVAGGSLNDHLDVHGPLPARLAAEVCVSVLTALQLAHDNGVIHRDIKPHNVLLARDGTAKVTDFGIARVQADDSPSLTRTGSVMGTWAYMAPEQRAGSRGIDGRADVYSTGAMLVDLLTGEAPADVFMCELHTHMLDGVPAALRPIVQRAVRYAPADRFASASEMARALLEAIPSLPTVPEDHPRLGSAGAPGPTLSPSGNTPAATYAFEDDGRPPNPGTPSKGGLTLSPRDFPPRGREPSDTSLSGAAHAPAAQSPAPRGRRAWLLAAIPVAGLLAAGLWVATQSATAPTGQPVIAATPAAAAPVPQETVVPVAASLPPQPSSAQPALTTPSPAATPPAEKPVPKAVAVQRAAPSPVAPEVTAAPAAAPQAPAPPAPRAVPVASGSVSVSGDADSILLVGAGGRFPPGEVPAGTYSVEAAFGGGALAPAGKVTVTAGQSVTIKCVADFARCK